MIKTFFSKDRALGVSERRKYDIPLDQGSNRFFLTLLIGLMVFLAMLSISASFALTQFADRWQTGLEGQWTVELPGVNKNGDLISREKLKDQAIILQKALEDFPEIKAIEILSDEELKELLSPWFELSDQQNTDLPLPVLLTLRVENTSAETAAAIKETITGLNADARLDRHQEWLENLLKLTSSLRLIAFLFTAVISIAAITAIAGAVQSRMAEHKESVQLLHLMGASDLYIMKQFERHGVIIALQGGIAGLLCGLLLLIGIAQYLSGINTLQIPKIELTAVFWGLLFILPFLAAGLAALTTRWTVLHTLSRMP